MEKAPSAGAPEASSPGRRYLTSAVGDRGEVVEVQAFRDVYASLADGGYGRKLEIAGAVCGAIPVLPDVPMVNRVLGLGLEGQATHEDLDTIEGFFRDLGTSFYVSVSPSAAGLAELLEERGYAPGYAWAVFRRDARPYEFHSALRLEEIGREGAEDFGTVIAQAYGMPRDSAPAIGAIVGRPNWTCFVTYDGDDPAGAAAVYVQDRVAWFGFAGTREEHRRKGSQGALFAARIRKAAELGADLLATETGALAPGRPSNSYRNIIRGGFEERFVRPNYAPPG